MLIKILIILIINIKINFIINIYYNNNNNNNYYY